MTEWLLPIGVVVASLALTYFLCLRPMRRGSAESAAVGRQAGCHASNDAGRNGEIENELARARAELTELKAARVEVVPAGASLTATKTTGGSGS